MIFFKFLNNMKLSILLFLIFIQLNAFTQVSFNIENVFILPEVKFPICKQWGEDYYHEQFDELNSNVLDSLAQVVMKNKDLKFQINYHLSSRGNDTINQLLTQKRANEILNYLLKRGVNSTQLKAIGYGETNPRKVWLIDNQFYIEYPKNSNAILVELSEDFINSFKTDKRKFEYLHSLNNRIEIQIIN